MCSQRLLNGGQTETLFWMQNNCEYLLASKCMCACQRHGLKAFAAASNEHRIFSTRCQSYAVGSKGCMASGTERGGHYRVGLGWMWVVKSSKRVGDGLGGMDLGQGNLSMATEDFSWGSRGLLRPCVTNAVSN